MQSAVLTSSEESEMQCKLKRYCKSVRERITYPRTLLHCRSYKLFILCSRDVENIRNIFIVWVTKISLFRVGVQPVSKLEIGTGR